jgi:hypothetical protein
VRAGAFTPMAHVLNEQHEDGTVVAGALCMHSELTIAQQLNRNVRNFINFIKNYYFCVVYIVE